MVGIKAANALSEYLVVTSCRDNKIARMRFERGVKKDFKVEKSPPDAKRGTTIEFLPDSTIFKDGIEIQKKELLNNYKSFLFYVLI